MKTPDDINDIISARVDAEFPRPAGGFENDQDALEWQTKKENRFAELARDFSDDTDNTFTVNFSRGEQTAGDVGTFVSLAEATAFAEKEAKSYAGHVDFKGGVFEVWEHGTPYSSFGEDHFRHSVHPIVAS